MTTTKLALCAIMAVVADTPKRGGALQDLVKAETMFQLALALPIGCLVGWFLGSLVDRHFHQSWAAVTGILLGAAGGFIQIFTTAARFMKQGK